MLVSQLPTKEDFEEWKSQPMTQIFFHHLLGEWKESLQDQWSSGLFSRETLEETAVANLQAVAQARLLSELSELDYQKFTEVLSDD
jgi:hypothetical protein